MNNTELIIMWDLNFNYVQKILSFIHETQIYEKNSK